MPCGVTPMAVQSRGTNIGTHNFYAYARRAPDEESERLTWKRGERGEEEKDDDRRRRDNAGSDGERGEWKETADTKRSGREDTQNATERSGAQTENDR